NVYFYISRANARYHRRDARGVLDYRMACRLDTELTAREIVRMVTEDLVRDAEAVLENCTKHLRINSRDVIASCRRGLTLLLLGREAEAAADLTRALELAPDGLVPLRRAIALARSGNGPMSERGAAAALPADEQGRSAMVVGNLRGVGEGSTVCVAAV